MFKSQSIVEALAKNGFAVMEAGLYSQTEELREYIKERFNFNSGNLYYSLLENIPDQNRVLQSEINYLLNGFFTGNFSRYRVLTQSFLVKPAHTPEELFLHQDWCYTDERKDNAYNIWIPLSDVNEENGTMFFLKGSHLWFDNLRSATLPTARISMNNFSDGQVITVKIKRGQVLLFHPAVFHGSYPNISSENRIVVTATVLGDHARFLYYQQSELPGEVNVFELGDEAFLKELNTIAVGKNPDAPISERIKYCHRAVSIEDLKLKLANFVIR